MAESVCPLPIKAVRITELDASGMPIPGRTYVFACAPDGGVAVEMWSQDNHHLVAGVRITRTDT